MKHIKHISTFLNEDVHYESFPKPKWFFLVTRDNLFDKISTMELEGVSGISSSPDIINSWFDIRNVMLVMPGDKILEINNLHPVYYRNPDQLVSNNLKLLSRLKQDYNAENPVKSTLNGVLRNATYQLIRHKKNYYKRKKYEDKNPDIIELMEYVKRKSWKISEGVAKRIDDGFTINNMNDFNNIVYKTIMDESDVPSDTSANVPYGTKPFDKSELTKENLMKVLKACVYYTGNVFHKEAEWIVKDKKLNVPKGTKLVIKRDVGNYGKKRYDTRGLKKEQIEELFDKHPEIKDKYEIIFVDNRDEAYEKFKYINK